MPKEILTPKNSSPDTLLYSILDYLRSLPPEDRTSVVAGIYNLNTGELLAATSYQFRDPHSHHLIWNHAECEVLSGLPPETRKRRGQLRDPEDYLFVSSLSPCARDSSTRAHSSCTQLLVGAGLSGEYTGKIDNNAAKTGLYQDLNFSINLTNDPILLAVCHELYKFFIPYKKKGWTKQRIIETALSHLPVQFYLQVPAVPHQERPGT